MRRIILTAVTAVVVGCGHGPAQRWSEAKANEWYDGIEWPVGCDYVPSYAANQFEMWQDSSWDPERIDLELGWAEGLGFNTVRIFLHDQLWAADPDGFFAKVDDFLGIADSHGISTLPTLFTNGGSEDRHIDEDAEPVPGIHNSLWAQSPGASIVNDPSRWGDVERYEKAVLKRFGKDNRIIAWCIYNEPENNDACNTLPLLKEVFRWAREVNPEQPLTATVVTNPFVRPKRHMKRLPLISFICENSDIMSFHSYDDSTAMADFITLMKGYNRPVFCTEYLGRQRGSTFESSLPLLKADKVAAYSFGLAAGRTQLRYEWNDVVDGKKVPFTTEPELWFHDILHEDGSPWDSSEVAFLKEICRQSR